MFFFISKLDIYTYIHDWCLPTLCVLIPSVIPHHDSDESSPEAIHTGGGGDDGLLVEERPGAEPGATSIGHGHPH